MLKPFITFNNMGQYYTIKQVQEMRAKSVNCKTQILEEKNKIWP